jgi:raffinose/stachyose/melibiose transport system permease protein
LLAGLRSGVGVGLMSNMVAEADGTLVRCFVPPVTQDIPVWLVTTERPSLYEAAKLDGANAWDEFRWITLPGLRQEIGVCVTVTLIAALASFDIVYIATGGGPGHSTTVPGLQIYRLAFAHREVGLASALGVILMLLVIICVLPIQWLTRVRR